MPTMFSEKRTTILWLHGSVVLLTAAVLYFGDPLPGFTLNNWLTLLLLAGQAALVLLYGSRTDDSLLTYLVVLSDIGGACLAVWLSDPPGSTFYALLFLLLIVLATFPVLVWQVAGGLFLCLCYPVIVALGGWEVEGVHWLSAMLLAGCGLFFGYLTRLQRAHQERMQAGAAYADNLFEFGKTLSKVEDPDGLHDRIPRLVAAIMGVDNCELALIEDERIVRRILPNRHCRDFVNLELADSIHQRTVLSKDVFASTEMQEDPGFSQKRDFALYPYRGYLGKAWAIQGKTVGVMALYTEKRGTWSEHAKKQFQFLVGQSVLALQNARLRQELADQARTDGLTGLVNHRHFYERLEDEFARARRKNHVLSVALIDLDHFKKLNDTAGHRVGDQVLQALSELFRSSIRKMDVAGRLGGDEFAIALPETSNHDALILCRRVLEAAAKLEVADWSGFSLSIGCATFPQDAETLNEIIEHADQALYHSKHLGRGRVSLYSQVVEAAK